MAYLKFFSNGNNGVVYAGVDGNYNSYVVDSYERDTETGEFFPVSSKEMNFCELMLLRIKMAFNGFVQVNEF